MDLKAQFESLELVQDFFREPRKRDEISQCLFWNAKTLEYEVSATLKDSRAKIYPSRGHVILLTRTNADVQAIYNARDEEFTGPKGRIFASGTNETLMSGPLVFSTKFLKGLAFQYMFMVPLLDACKTNSYLLPYVSALKSSINRYIDIFEFASKFGMFFQPDVGIFLGHPIESYLKNEFALYYYVSDLYIQVTKSYLPGMKQAKYIYLYYFAGESSRFDYLGVLGYLFNYADWDDVFRRYDFRIYSNRMNGMPERDDIEVYANGTNNLLEYALSLPKDLYVK
jgi:hypothetical protein